MFSSKSNQRNVLKIDNIGTLAKKYGICGESICTDAAPKGELTSSDCGGELKEPE